MASLAQLYKKAKSAGFSPSEIRGKNAAEIQELLDSKKSNGSKSKAKATKATKKVVAKKKTGAKRGRPRKAAATAQAPAKKRGRPKGSKNKSTASTRTRKAQSNGNSTDGRHLLSGIKWNVTDGWNPRAGSPPDRIIKSLKKHKGDREKVFAELKSDIWDFMGKVKRNGEKRTKAEAEEMLRYRISRTAWQFALQTGQHEVASDRVEYGTGGTGAGTFKRGKAKPAKKTAKKRGRPAKAQKASKASSNSGGNVSKDMSDQALRKYLKSFEGKRGRRPAEYQTAVRMAKRRKLNV